ncbi:hypothetical protein JTB14_038267 [Gonioctena quinquepunctata]|nr:hypothetical protein JTB14_038267 [Gonioctena quinquepunctata]
MKGQNHLSKKLDKIPRVMRPKVDCSAIAHKSTEKTILKHSNRTDSSKPPSEKKSVDRIPEKQTTDGVGKISDHKSRSRSKEDSKLPTIGKQPVRQSTSTKSKSDSSSRLKSRVAHKTIQNGTLNGVHLSEEKGIEILSHKHVESKLEAPRKVVLDTSLDNLSKRADSPIDTTEETNLSLKVLLPKLSDTKPSINHRNASGHTITKRLEFISPEIIMKDDVLEVTIHEHHQAATPTKINRKHMKYSKQTRRVSQDETEKKKHPSRQLQDHNHTEDADLSSDEEKKLRSPKSKLVKKLPESSLCTLNKKCAVEEVSSESIPKRPSKPDTGKKFNYLKKKAVDYSPTHVVKKFDSRVHRYMMSTVSRDMKVEKKEKDAVESMTIKSKREMDNFNEKLKSKQKLEATNKSKTVEKVAKSSPSTPKKESKEMKPVDSNKLAEVKKAPAEIYPRIASPKPSPSPTKLRRTVVTEHIKKISSHCSTEKPSYDKTVQFADRVRSQSVTPSTFHELIEEDRKSTSPTSLPGSPIRVRSANGGTKLVTSEVFTRTENHTGSIEVIYRQPYENIRRVASALRNETEMSLIDTTDSSLSESVALPSSPSDHDVSSDANGRFKSLSPTSPKQRRSLESIHEISHRISDLITNVPEVLSSEKDISLPRKLVMSQYEGMKHEEASASHKSEERLSPIIDVEVVSPPRRKYQFGYVEEGTAQGNTSYVLPDPIAMSSYSMASRIDSRKEV